MLLYAKAKSTAEAPDTMFMAIVLIAMNLNSLALVSSALGTMFSEVKSICIDKILTMFPRISWSYIPAKSPDEQKNIADSTMPKYPEQENILLWSFSVRSCRCIMADAKPKSQKRLKKLETMLAIATMANCSGTRMRASIAVINRLMATPEYFATAMNNAPLTSCFFTVSIGI